MKITVIALIALDSKGSSRAASLIHQVSHTHWPLVVQPAQIGVHGKIRDINIDMLRMLRKCQVPCLLVDSDIVFTRNIEIKLRRVMEKIDNTELVLHLCPGCLYNRMAVHKNPETLWHRHPPEKHVSAEKDDNQTIYMTAPFPTCWYGGPVAMLLRSKYSVHRMMSEISRNMDTPCDVIFNKAKHNHALVEPLCRENEQSKKDSS